MPDLAHTTLIFWLAFALLWLIPVTLVCTLWPPVTGRYARHWLRWFKTSVVANLLGWGVILALLLAMAETLGVFHQEMLQQQGIAFVAIKTTFQQDMRERIEQEIDDAHLRFVAAEDALLKLWERQAQR